MKVYVFSLFLLINTAAVMAEEECEPAVDAASRMVDNKHCDYSKTGLNGVLHRAFSANSDVKENGKADEATTQDKDKNALVSSEPVKIALQQNEFASPQQLQALRYALVLKAAQECTKGFVVESEKFLPAEGKALKLELVHHCL